MPDGRSDPGLTRRHSDSDRIAVESYRPPSQGSDDSNLAYGEMPPPLPARPNDAETELKSKMVSLTRMLEEADCLKYTASSIIKSLEDNPEKMAAVALTLAEISNLLTRLGPPALASMKGTFPTIIALLACPEFAIAIGVGVGLTVVALGGYKIIKKIKSKPAEAKPQVEELEDVGCDINSIEAWRRGIEFPDDQSIGTSVEAELITPSAARHLEEEGVLRPRERSPNDKKERKGKDKDKDRKNKSTKSDSSSRSSKASDDGKGSKKQLSGLKMLFKK